MDPDQAMSLALFSLLFPKMIYQCPELLPNIRADVSGEV